MKSRPLSALIALAGTFRSVVAQTPSGCFDNFTEIGLIEDFADVQQVRTYILCPNSTFTIASVTDQGTLIGDDTPLAIRANMRVLCGDDGKVENNCRLKAGSFGIAAFFDLYGFEYLHNVVIAGLTFDDHKLYGAIFLLPGVITFYDCVFKNMGNLAPSLALWYPEDFFEPIDGRRLQKASVKSWKNRHMQEFSPVYREPTPDDILHISYINCEFENNYAIRLPSDEGLPGVVIAQGQTKTTVLNTKFANNTYPAKGRYDVGFMILQDGGIVEVENSCFDSNYVDGPAPIVLLFGQAAAATNEVAQPQSQNRCELIAEFDNLEQGLSGPIKACTQAGAQGVCASLPSLPHILPSEAPTFSPAPSISSMPSPAPSTTWEPTGEPTAKPTVAPTGSPSAKPAVEGVDGPTDSVLAPPTSSPTAQRPPTSTPATEAEMTMPPTQFSGARAGLQTLVPVVLAIGAAFAAL